MNEEPTMQTRGLRLFRLLLFLADEPAAEGTVLFSPLYDNKGDCGTWYGNNAITTRKRIELAAKFRLWHNDLFKLGCQYPAECKQVYRINIDNRFLCILTTDLDLNLPQTPFRTIARERFISKIDTYYSVLEIKPFTSFPEPQFEPQFDFLVEKQPKILENIKNAAIEKK